MAMLPQRRDATPAPPPPPGQVVVRKYDSEQAFAIDASSMANAGWQVATQSSGSSTPALAALGAVLAVIGILVWIPLVVIGLVLAVAGMALRKSNYTVTYRYDSASDVRGMGSKQT
jgi:hypothetical protein